jgi:Uma2 family endonuclease
MAEVLDFEIELQTKPALKMDEEQFFQFCQLNKDYRIERTSEGNIIVVSPEGAGSGSGSARLTHLFYEWAEADGTGIIFGSSTGFTLPNKAVRSPDVSWVLKSRLKSISDHDWSRFLPLCPDFALELRSPSDRLPKVHAKMQEYIANGARLGWLLDPERKQVHIYRPRVAVRTLTNPREVSGDPVLPGFRLAVPKIWAAMKPIR